MGDMRRALVADDNSISRRLFVGMLRRLGFECDDVDDGDAALLALARRSYDLILMDCEMPTVNGREAAVAIRVREVDGLLTRTPIIAVTAHQDRFSEADCREAGMDGYLRKPVSLESLSEAVEAVLPGFRDVESPSEGSG